MTKVILGPFTGTPILKETPMILTCPPTWANVVPAYNLIPNTALL